MADLAFLTSVPFAHRGLHGSGVVENTRAAFEAAIAAGHGIETDVQVSKDGIAFAFHDYELDRLTKKTGPVIDRKAAKLETIGFQDADETIPRLTDALDLIAGRAPLLIEVKVPNRKVKKLCRSVAEALADYRGNAAVMSFNPEVGRWFARHAPRIVRGLVVSEEDEGGFVERLKAPIERSLSVFRAKPHFLAYDVRSLPSAFAEPLRAEGMPVLSWTVRSDANRETAALHADQIIYEKP